MLGLESDFLSKFPFGLLLLLLFFYKVFIPACGVKLYCNNYFTFLCLLCLWSLLKYLNSPCDYTTAARWDDPRRNSLSPRRSRARVHCTILTDSTGQAYWLSFTTFTSEIHSLFQECNNSLIKHRSAWNRLVTEEAKTNLHWKNQPSQMDFVAGHVPR